MIVSRKGWLFGFARAGNLNDETVLPNKRLQQIKLHEFLQAAARCL